jgi:predicted Zn-dependent peptidase
MKINLAGTFDSMNSITREKMAAKFKELYQPNNMILCVVGDANFDEIVQFAEKNFNSEKGKIPQMKFNSLNETKTDEREGVDQANLVFAYHVPTAEDKRSYAAIVLNSLMADGMSSRLFSEIREKRNLAYAVKGEANINRTFAYNYIYVGTMKDNIDKIKKLILEEFEKVSKSLGDKELKIIKEKLIGNYQISMEDSQEQMVNLLKTEIDGNAEEFYKFEENISQVKLDDVKELAKRATKNFSFFALVPK